APADVSHRGQCPAGPVPDPRGTSLCPPLALVSSSGAANGSGMTSAPLRFGLVGTGYWARIAHAPALAATEGIELAAVWGRDPGAAAALAAEHGATSVDDIDALLAAVDGVAFAVPPDVQAPIAAAAARAGKHLMLEKPIAIAEAE